MIAECMDQLPRPASPPEQAIYTIQKAIARRDLPTPDVHLPTPDVHGKRRIVMIRGTGGLPATIRILGGTLSRSFAQPRPGVGAFFGIAQGTAPGVREVGKTQGNSGELPSRVETTSTSIFETPSTSIKPTSTSIVAARRPEALAGTRKVQVPASPFSFETRALRVRSLEGAGPSELAGTSTFLAVKNDEITSFSARVSKLGVWQTIQKAVSHKARSGASAQSASRARAGLWLQGYLAERELDPLRAKTTDDTV